MNTTGSPQDVEGLNLLANQFHLSANGVISIDPPGNSDADSVELAGSVSLIANNTSIQFDGNGSLDGSLFGDTNVTLDGSLTRVNGTPTMYGYLGIQTNQTDFILGDVELDASEIKLLLNTSAVPAWWKVSCYRLAPGACGSMET